MTVKLQTELLLEILRCLSDEKITTAKENTRKHQNKKTGLLDVEQSP